jgi:hypothetical protein
MVMLKKLSLTFACSALLFLATGTQAQTWNKKTTLTFSEAVELPGVTLSAGTYVFKLVDLPATRNVVQVFNADETEVLAAILAVPHEHATAHDKTIIGFEERRSGLPMAIHEWFYPGDVRGLEFVYPKQRARELAREVHEPVLAAEVTPHEAPAELEEAPVVEVTPEEREIAVAETFEPAVPFVVEHNEVPFAGHELPQTASPVWLYGFTGLMSLALAVFARKLARKTERT